MLSAFDKKIALSALIESIRDFLDCIRLPVAIIDIDGVYVYYNEESAQIDGCERSYAEQRRLLDVYPTMKPEESTMLASLHKGTVFTNHRQNYFNAAGKLVDYAHSTAPLYGPDNAIIGAIEVGFDLSKNEKLQKQVFELTRSLTQGESGNKRQTTTSKIVTRSPVMLELMNMGKRFAGSTAPVVIVGASGTGKELFAHLVHAFSARANKPLVTLSCGAIPETLIESTLFGTVKGAFTDAKDNEGFLALADGGTLFLDEFNSISLSVQVKFLRYLQSKEYHRVGGTKIHHSDARIIVAMNESPTKLMAEGRLRADLYYRLNVAVLNLPPLQERKEDIPLLAEHFIEKYADSVPYKIHGISRQALDSLLARAWPGNIRMLENAILRSMLLQNHNGQLECIVEDHYTTALTDLAHDTVPRKPLPQVALDIETDQPLDRQVEAFEKGLIINALNQSKGNVSRAAELLGLKRTTLNYKIRKHNLRLGVVSPDN